MNKIEELRQVFYPESIAIVGASRDEQKMGSVFLSGFLISGFKGKLYPVNPIAEEIMGLKAFPTVSSIPDHIDYVLVSVPRDLVIDVLDDAIKKGVRVIQIFTAGFSETGDTNGKILEERIINMIHNSKTRLIGPNCIGVLSPEIGMSFYGLGEEGFTAFISQSGGHATRLIIDGTRRRLGFSKIISYGNGCDLNELDFLEYLAEDPKTKVIGMYLEGSKNGKRLSDMIREVSKIKPIVLWKGGRTDIGAKAASSHTGSLSGSYTVWKDVMRQVGAINVESFEELSDTLLAFQSLPKIKKGNIALIGGFADGAGGASVAGSDACTNVGLSLSLLEEEVNRKINNLIPSAGSIKGNPFDLSQIGGNLELLREIFELISLDKNIELLLINNDVDINSFFMPPSIYEQLIDLFINFKNLYKKPIAVVIPPALLFEKEMEIENKLLDASIPIFPSIDRAAKAIMNVVSYWKRKNKMDNLI